jgi:hypothetical protein
LRGYRSTSPPGERPEVLAKDRLIDLRMCGSTIYLQTNGRAIC